MAAQEGVAISLKRVGAVLLPETLFLQRIDFACFVLRWCGLRLTAPGIYSYLYINEKQISSNGISDGIALRASQTCRQTAPDISLALRSLETGANAAAYQRLAHGETGENYNNACNNIRRLRLQLAANLAAAKARSAEWRR